MTKPYFTFFILSLWTRHFAKFRSESTCDWRGIGIQNGGTIENVADVLRRFADCVDIPSNPRVDVIYATGTACASVPDGHVQASDFSALTNNNSMKRRSTTIISRYLGEAGSGITLFPAIFILALCYFLWLENDESESTQSESRFITGDDYIMELDNLDASSSQVPQTVPELQAPPQANQGFNCGIAKDNIRVVFAGSQAALDLQTTLEFANGMRFKGIFQPDGSVHVMPGAISIPAYGNQMA